MMPSHCLQLIKPALFSNNAMHLYRHAEANYLLAHWVSVSDTQQVYAGLQAIIQAVSEQGTKGLLTQMSEKDTLAPGAMPSIVNRYLPDIINAGVNCFATVLPPRVYSLATAEIVLNCIPPGLQAQSFQDVLLAHSWLQEQLVAVNYR